MPHNRAVRGNGSTSHYRRKLAERRALKRVLHVPDERDPADVVAVRAAVAALPERQRVVVVLRHYLQWPVADVAAHLSLSEGAVRALTHRGLLTLRDQIRDSQPLAEPREENRDGSPTG